MPCLSSSALSPLKESIKVSNAESQLALPLAITTFFASSVIASPKGSAVWTVAEGAGVCAVGGGAAGAGEGFTGGAGLAGGAGEGLVETPGEGEAGGCCATTAPPESSIAAAGISAARARQRKQAKFIQYSPWGVSGSQASRSASG